MARYCLPPIGLAIVLSVASPYCGAAVAQSNAIESSNPAGISRTITTESSFDTANPFFQPLGTNGRSCATCHGLSEALTFSPTHAQNLFESSQGSHPLFAPVDGVDSPSADMSTYETRLANTTLIRTKGLIRVELTVPKNAEFVIERVEDPYNYATTSRISAYRRPLSSTNLRFASTVMWDGRELPSPGKVKQALRSQVIDAVLGHMQASAPPSAQIVTRIVDFETKLYTTQVFDNEAGALDEDPINAGPESLLQSRGFRLASRRPTAHRAAPPHRAPRPPRFDLAAVFHYFRPWSQPPAPGKSPQELKRESIARGEKLFNTRPFTISHVPGLTDKEQSKLDRRGRTIRSTTDTPMRGTCATCHNVSSVGSSQKPLLLNTGLADGSLRTADLPLYSLKNIRTGERIQTTDPGAAMKSGKWKDIGKFKVPSLRALETHSPYMHNGMSDDLQEILRFYDNRFSIGLTAREKADLEAFMEAL